MIFPLCQLICLVLYHEISNYPTKIRRVFFHEIHTNINTHLKIEFVRIEGHLHSDFDLVLRLRPYFSFRRRKSRTRSFDVRRNRDRQAQKGQQDERSFEALHIESISWGNRNDRRLLRVYRSIEHDLPQQRLISM